MDKETIGLVDIRQLTLGDILNHIAYPDPSWGGGSAGALAGAMALALLDKINAIHGLERDETKSLALLALAEQETTSYAQILAAKSDPAAKRVQIRSSLMLSARIARTCLDEALAAAGRLGQTQPILRADLIVALHMFYVAASSAVVNIRVNKSLFGEAFDFTDLEGDLKRLANHIQKWTESP